MKLIERDRELSILQSLFDSRSAGTSDTVVIRGPAGSGKTAIMQEFGERVAESGAVVLTTMATSTDHAIPLGTFGQLFHSPHLSPSQLERVKMLLADSISPHRQEAMRESALQIPPSILNELTSIILELAERTPTVIIVDDVHNADLASLQALLYLMRRMKISRLLLVLGECSHMSHSYPIVMAEILSWPNRLHIDLPLLSPGGVEQMIASELGEEEAHSLAARFHAASGGNPLLVRGLIDDSRSDCATDHAVPGKAYAEAAMRFLYRYGPHRLKAFQALALLGEDISVDLIRKLPGLDSETIQQTFRILETAGFLTSGNALRLELRDAIRNSMTPERRSVMSHLVASRLHACNAPAQVIARYLISVNCETDPWMVDTLRTAAEDALAADDADFATAALRMAYEACSDARQRAEIRLAQIHAMWRNDPSAAARLLPEVSAAAREGDLDRSQAFTASFYLIWFGHVDEALGILHLDELNEQDTESTESTVKNSARIEPEIVNSWLRYGHPGLFDFSKYDTPSAPEVYEQLPRFGILTRFPDSLAAIGFAAMLVGKVPAHAAIGSAEATLQVIHVSESTITSAITAISVLIYADVLDKASFWCQRFLADVSARQATTWHALFAAIRATIEFRTGQLTAAENFAQEALGLIPPKNWGVAIGIPMVPAILARTAAGRYAEAAKALKIPVPASTFSTPSGLSYLHARGRYYLATGLARAALNDFNLCGDLVTRWELDVPSFIPWRSDAVKALVAVGEMTRARTLVAEQLAQVPRESTRTLGLTLRAGGAADPGNGLRMFWRAIEALKESGDKLELALTFADLSGAYRAIGDHRRARSSAQTAHIIADQCGAKLPENVIPEYEIPEKPIDDSRGMKRILELSDAERRVAVLAAAGDTNRQIAKKLHITVSTVEQHLTRAYRKLRVSRRADLPLELHLDQQRTLTSGGAQLTGAPGRTNLEKYPSCRPTHGCARSRLPRRMPCSLSVFRTLAAQRAISAGCPHCSVRRLTCGQYSTRGARTATVSPCHPTC